jgi:hypothetical protein
MRKYSAYTCGFVAVVCSLLIADSAHAIKILMHGREAAPSFRDDPITFAHLQSVFGAENVTYMQGSVAPADGSAVNGFDVLYISSTMASSDTRDKYEDSTVGIVCSENALIHDNNIGNFMLSDAGGNQDNINDRQTINILDPTHPLAAGLSGEVTVYDSPIAEWWQFGTGDLGAGVDLIADMVLPGDPAPPAQHAIFAADGGAALLGDGTPGRPATAAGRRVFFFMSDFGSADLTADGMKLFDAAINWAAEKPATGDFDNDGDVDGADFLAWQKGFGISGTAQRSDGDANGDKNVNVADLAIWQAKFTPSAAAAVPEPTTIALGVLVCVSGLANGRKQRLS